MNKNDANILLAEQLELGLADIINNALRDANRLYSEESASLRRQFSPEVFGRLYSDLCANCVQISLLNADWGKTQFEVELENRGAYPRVKIQKPDVRLIVTRDGSHNAKYFTEAVQLNRPAGRSGLRCLQLDYCSDNSEGIISAEIVVPTNKSKKLAQSPVFPEKTVPIVLTA